MGPDRGTFRRRKTRVRTATSEPSGLPNGSPYVAEASILCLRWRRMLALIEMEAARHRCGEIQMLAGVTGLAVDDMITVKPEGEVTH